MKNLKKVEKIIEKSMFFNDFVSFVMCCGDHLSHCCCGVARDGVTNDRDSTYMIASRFHECYNTSLVVYHFMCVISRL